VHNDLHAFRSWGVSIVIGCVVALIVSSIERVHYTHDHTLVFNVLNEEEAIRAEIPPVRISDEAPNDDLDIELLELDAQTREGATTTRV
jgi:hypothetical protein